jgi:hypothetical protein
MTNNSDQNQLNRDVTPHDRRDKTIPLNNCEKPDFEEFNSKSSAEGENRPSEIARAASNDQLCKVCGGDHNVLFIALEKGGHIITEHFFKEGPVKINVKLNVKRKATTLDLINLFWSVDDFWTGN